MLEKLVGLRKMLVSLGILGVACGAVYFKGDVPAGLIQVLGFIFTGFVIGNAVEHVTDGSIEKATIHAEAKAAEETQPVAEAATKEQVAALAAQLQAMGDGVNNVQNALVMIIKKYGIDQQ